MSKYCVHSSIPPLISPQFVMRSAWFQALTALFLSQFLVRIPVHAASFPDVAEHHIYSVQIEALADRGIIKGNPDGSFKPEKTVNRAEMLTFLYRATGKSPATTAFTKQCMKDVPRGEWYEATVCDAITRGYVGGYPDGNFRPGQEVNRVEALKMIQTVFGFTLNSNASLDPVKAYTDVSLTAWYTPYMANAFSKKILPINGQEPPKFYPERALLRGEAAAYIFNALGLTLESASSSIATSQTSSATTRSSARSVAAEPEARLPINVDFPFSDESSFVGKEGKSYVFSLEQSIVASFEASVDADSKNNVSCRLYKLNKDTAFALEYYVGHRVDNRCVIRVALGSGDYQFEVSPSASGIAYSIFVNTDTGDGNDGFREALKLLPSSPKTSMLATDDMADWFWFKLEKQETMTVNISNDANVRCMIYPMEDVDLFGFNGPVCNAAYDFPKGTYYIGVQQRDEREEQQTFTIRYK